MTDFNRTFRLDRLYHRFLKPRGVPLKHLDDFATLLEIKGFIRTDLLGERYEETTKLSGRDNTKEFFALIQKFKGGLSDE